MIPARSASKDSNFFPRLRFGLVWNGSFLPARGIGITKALRNSFIHTPAKIAVLLRKSCTRQWIRGGSDSAAPPPVDSLCSLMAGHREQAQWLFVKISI